MTRKIPKPYFSLNDVQYIDPCSPCTVSEPCNDADSQAQEIMSKLVEKVPELHPEFFYLSTELVDESAKYSDDNSRIKYTEPASKLFALFRTILIDEEFMREVATELNASFMDILKSVYAYYGDLLIKKSQISRCIKAIVTKYSGDTQKLLKLDSILTGGKSEVSSRRDCKSRENPRTGENPGEIF